MLQQLVCVYAHSNARILLPMFDYAQVVAEIQNFAPKKTIEAEFNHWCFQAKCYIDFFCITCLMFPKHLTSFSIESRYMMLSK